MTYEQEQTIKAAAGQADALNIPSSTQGSQGGYATLDGDGEAKRENLQERVARRLSRARSESRKEARLEELDYLLRKNPEVARIIELIEDMQV